MAHLSVSTRRKTASRLARVTQSLRSMLREEYLHLLHLVPCWRPGWRQSTRMEKGYVSLVLCHGTAVAGVVIKLGAFLRWFAAITNSRHSGAGGKCLGELM